MREGEAGGMELPGLLIRFHELLPGNTGFQ